jgi:ATP-dependent Clp protease adaptor protein ClpS
VSDPVRPEEQEQGSVAVKTRRPRRFRVVIHNDDYSTMDFVIEVLTRIFKKTHAESVELMLIVHRTGVASVGTYTRDVAETLVAEVREFAHQQKQPLQLTMEPE